MTDQQNPFSNMPEPPAAPDPAPGVRQRSVPGAGRAILRRRPNRAGGLRPLPGSGAAALWCGQAYDPYQAQAQQQPYQQPYQATYEQPQPAYQQVYAQPVAPAAPTTLYPMTDTDRNLRLVAFIFCILSLVGSVLAHHSAGVDDPHVGHLLGHLQGTKANTVAFGVCTLIFCSLVAGILLLCSNKDR